MTRASSISNMFSNTPGQRFQVLFSVSRNTPQHTDGPATRIGEAY